MKAFEEFTSRRYDIATGRTAEQKKYFASQPMRRGFFADTVLEAQRSGAHIACSYEWPGIIANLPEGYEYRMGKPSWTRTLINFDTGEILDDIVLREDMPVKEVRTNLMDGIESATQYKVDLPTKSDFVARFVSKFSSNPQKFDQFLSVLLGTDPVTLRAKFGPYFISINHNGIVPVVRGYWPHVAHEPSSNVIVQTRFHPAESEIGAWAVYDNMPENNLEISEEERLREEVLDRFADIMSRPGAI